MKEKKTGSMAGQEVTEMAEMRTLENEYLIVEVNDAGAELSRVYDKKKEREVLWNADAKYWGRHAPILFPFVGKLNGGVYRYEGA